MVARGGDRLAEAGRGGGQLDGRDLDVVDVELLLHHLLRVRVRVRDRVRVGVRVGMRVEAGARVRVSFSSITCLSTVTAMVSHISPISRLYLPYISPSITCLSTVTAMVSPSTSVRFLWYCSCSAVCAPSAPAPIALASKRVCVPEGSVWYSAGPCSSQPGQGSGKG